MTLDKVNICNLNLEPGDIGAIGERLPVGWLFSPETDRFHHFLVWRRVPGDWIILESISKGLAVGRLSMYAGKDVKFYRAECLDAATRARACDELTRYGRSPYDWLLCIRIAWHIAAAEWAALRAGHWLRRIRAEELAVCDDSWLVCTEAVVVAYKLVGWSLVPDGVLPLPCAIEQARLDGLIREVTYE